MEIPRLLAIDDCPLLNKDVSRLSPILDRFNDAVRLLNELSTRNPRYLDQEDVRMRITDLHDIADRLQRRRYHVGLLGRSQSGKSATLNNILQISQEDKPWCEGVGTPTTRVITRLHAIRTGPNTLRARYLSINEYKEKRNALCSLLGLPNTQAMTEAQILEQLSKAIPPSSAGAPQRQPLPDDKSYLKDLLESYQNNRNLIQNEPLYETPNPLYEERGMFMNHPLRDKEGKGVSRLNLLAEVELGYCTQEIPPDLELVDCPGLGAPNSLGTLVARNVVPKLDGALLLLSADLVSSSPIEQFVVYLREMFRGQFASHVWIIVNKFDSPSRDAKLVGYDGRTVFDVIAGLCVNYGIPLSQVCLTCNPIYKEFARNGSIAREPAMEIIQLRADDPVPPRCLAYPALAAAFDQLLKDGGISNVRRIIQEVMPNSVAAEVYSLAGSRLHGIVTDLQNLVRLSNKAIKPTSNPITAFTEVSEDHATSGNSVAKNGTNDQELLGAETRDSKGPRIFISYRRSDDPYAAHILRDYLADHFGTQSVFMDVDCIPVGVDFVEYLQGEVEKCNCFMAVIGESWLSVCFEEGPGKGERRLDDANDFVRIEIESALARRIPVIPVLVGRAYMPRSQDLPSSLAKLARMNAAEMRAGLDMKTQITRLIRAIEKLVAKP